MYNLNMLVCILLYHLNLFLLNLDLIYLIPDYYYFGFALLMIFLEFEELKYFYELFYVWIKFLFLFFF